MITTPKRRSPKATIPQIAIERATLVLQQLPPKSRPTSSTTNTKRGQTLANPAKSTRSAGRTSIVAALNATAIAEKRAFLNRKIKDVISVLLDDAPPKKKTRKTKKEGVK